MKIRTLKTTRILHIDKIAQDRFAVAETRAHAVVNGLEEVAGGVKMTIGDEELFVPWTSVDYARVEPGSMDPGKPTIAELEEILRTEGQEIEIQPNGEVRAKEESPQQRGARTRKEKAAAQKAAE